MVTPSTTRWLLLKIIHPLVNVQKTVENHYFSWENSLFLWQFSIANCLFTRGYFNLPFKLCPSFRSPQFFPFVKFRELHIAFCKPLQKRRQIPKRQHQLCMMCVIGFSVVKATQLAISHSPPIYIIRLFGG